SLTTDWKDLESNIRKKKDYFYVKKFPKATIEIDGATPTADGQYTTEAMLNLKGIRKPVTLTFTITDQAPYRVVGQGVIERKIFNFKGKGPKWEVPVNFDVVLPVD
ncbi:MAG: YceI family protein, partial [Bacteroidota bacterium]